jgi:hypothetical protein
MTHGVAGQRRGGLLRLLMLALLVGVAVGGVMFGPAIAAAVVRGGGALAVAKRKFQALHDFALFRSRGDKAVLRWGEPPKGRAKKPTGN